MSSRFAHLTLWIGTACLITATTSAFAGSATRQSGVVRISYVASEGVYLDAGRSVGLVTGDTLEVKRGKTTIGRIVISHAASKSAAATVINTSRPIKQGDLAILPIWVQARVMLDSASRATPKIVALPKTRNRLRRRPDRRVRGDISLQVYGRNDQTGSDASWVQPGIRTRLEIRNVGGTSAKLVLRHRSRAYYRSSPVAAGLRKDEWSHRVFEFGLVSDVRDADSKWGVGRILVPDVRGMGYIDGGYYTRVKTPQFRYGVAFGSAPNPITSGFNFGRKKLGLYGAYEMSHKTRGRLVLSGALSSEYDGGTVSRDFLYLQTVYSHGTFLSLYQSAEFDVNREWRYAKTRKRLEMSNLYSMLTASFGPRLGFDLSFDSRRQYQYAETRFIPDSLFDSDGHRGWRAGIRAMPISRVFIRINAGIRLHESDSVESRFYSFGARLTRFPGSRHTVSLNLSIVETGFTTGYRPVMSFRFPVARGLYLRMSGAAHVYKSATVTTSNYYLEVTTSKAFGARYSLSGSLRQYLDDQLKSTEFNMDLGIRL